MEQSAIENDSVDLPLIGAPATANGASAAASVAGAPHSPRLAKARRRKSGAFRRGLRYVVVVLGAAAMIAPMVYVVLESLKLGGQVITVPPELLPHPWAWDNYRQIFALVPVAIWALNSVLVTCIATVGAILSSTLGGYAFARLRFPGRDALFGICIATMMLPGVVTLIPQFIGFRHLGLINTFAPLILPSWLGVPFYMFFARQAFRGIPQEYVDAARVDGAGNWYIWARVVMPMSKPVVAVIAIYSVIFNWNDFLGPLVYLNSSDKLTLAVGLQTLVNAYSADWNIIMVGAVLMTVPMIAVFFVAQRYFMETNIGLSGLGGR